MNSRGIRCLNTEPDFDALIEQALGQYVYALLDPTMGNTVFYIGKGGGSGDGNQRVLSHLREAEKALQKPESAKSEKIVRIHNIWGCGQKVGWSILAYALRSSETALAVEAAFIDYFGMHNLTNAQRGHDAVLSGRLSPDDVYLLGAPSVCPKEDYPAVLIFNIQKELKKGRSSPYDATRGWWKGTNAWESKATHAVGLVNGISRCVIAIEGWQSWGEAMQEAGVDGPPDYFDEAAPWDEVRNKRRGCFGKHYTERDSHELLLKNYQSTLARTGWWQFGNWLVVRFSNGSPTLLRPTILGNRPRPLRRAHTQAHD